MILINSLLVRSICKLQSKQCERNGNRMKWHIDFNTNTVDAQYLLGIAWRHRCKYYAKLNRMNSYFTTNHLFTYYMRRTNKRHQKEKKGFGTHTFCGLGDSVWSLCVCRSEKPHLKFLLVVPWWWACSAYIQNTLSSDGCQQLPTLFFQL